jgi:hypothetical protein
VILLRFVAELDLVLRPLVVQPPGLRLRRLHHKTPGRNLAHPLHYIADGEAHEGAEAVLPPGCGPGLGQPLGERVPDGRRELHGLPPDASADGGARLCRERVEVRVGERAEHLIGEGQQDLLGREPGHPLLGG